VKGVEEAYPMDYGSYKPEEIILDLEFKIQPDRSIYFKQARPFRRSPATNPPSEGFPLLVEADLPVCGQFIENRDIYTERELGTKITLTGQDIILPFEGELPSISLIDQVSFGPEKHHLKRIHDPIWTREIFTDSQGTSHYLFTYTEKFTKEDISATVSHTFQSSFVEGSLTVDGFVINEDSISDLHNKWDMEVSISGESFPIRLSSCNYDNLPTYRRTATILSKYNISMDVKYYPAMIGTGNASLVSARMSFEKTSFTIDDYFRLTYSAAHHNWNEHLMVAFKKTAQQDIGGVIFEEPYPYESAPAILHILNKDMEITATEEVDSYLVEVVE